MTHGSLFAGIGGFNLPAEWVGWKNVLQCENDEFCQKVLRYYWPEATLYGDIKEADFTIWRGKIDILSGGFPCQPFSQAGKRQGTEDDRYLWPEMYRAIKEIKPGWIVAENVYGLVDWNGGLVLEQVLSDLEAEGYETATFIIPACGVNAPHKRDRTWIVAHPDNAGADKRMRTDRNRTAEDKRRQEQPQPQPWKGGRASSNTEAAGLEGTHPAGRVWSKRFNRQQSWEGFPTQSPVCSRDDGVPSRLDGITFPKWRNESIKAYGNAIVPQVAYRIFTIITELEDG